VPDGNFAVALSQRTANFFIRQRVFLRLPPLAEGLEVRIRGLIGRSMKVFKRAPELAARVSRAARRPALRFPALSLASRRLFAPECGERAGECGAGRLRIAPARDAERAALRPVVGLEEELDRADALFAQIAQLF